MYLDNKYTRWYNSIITAAQTRVNSIGYYEKHHIIPKSMGGNNDSVNLVKLTAREHFVCHLLLTKMTTGDHKRKMSYALWLMCNVKNQNQTNRYIPSSKTYLKIRENHSKVVSSSFIGIKKCYSSFAGKKHTEKTIKMQSDIKIGSKNPNFGVEQKSEWNLKKSDAQKGIPKPALMCEHCGKTVGGHGNYVRWHGDKCRLNTM
jgi:hypothetical protein